MNNKTNWIKQQILLKPSYFKEKMSRLALKFKCTEVEMQSIMKSLAKERKAYRTKSKKPSKYPVYKGAIPVEVKSIKSVKPTNLIKPGIHLVIGCVHVPFQNKELVGKLLKFINDYKTEIAGFHIIGDFLDMRSLSTHDNDSIGIPGIDLKYEYKAGNEVLDLFDSALPKGCIKTYLWGNHEDRYNRFTSLKATAEYAKSIPSPTEALKLQHRGYIVKDNWKEDSINLGYIELTHGFYCNATPAKKHLGVLKNNVMFAHTHRIDTYYESKHGSFNIGFLGDKFSKGFDYAPRIVKMNWMNGFGLIHMDSSGKFQADVIHCQDNSFFYAGKKY
jgi:hypothetical protein